MTEPTEKLKSTIKEYHRDSQIEYVRMGGYAGTGENNDGDGNGGLSGAGGQAGRAPKKKAVYANMSDPVVKTVSGQQRT